MSPPLPPIDAQNVDDNQFVMLHYLGEGRYVQLYGDRGRVWKFVSAPERLVLERTDEKIDLTEPV